MTVEEKEIQVNMCIGGKKVMRTAEHCMPYLKKK
jgi:hypothetical protein